MAACGGLEQIFETPLMPENPTFHESWKHIVSMKRGEDHLYSFTELRAQLYLKEKKKKNLDQDPPESSIASSLFTLSPSSSLSSSDRSSVCNEFESSDDADDPIKTEKCSAHDYEQQERRIHDAYDDDDDNNNDINGCEWKRSSSSRRKYGGFPPPISCIGKTGKPVWLQSIRKDGRFILTEVRIPCQDFVHAFRENGRLKLHYFSSEEEDEDEDEDEDEGEGEGEDEDEDEDEKGNEA